MGKECVKRTKFDSSTLIYGAPLEGRSNQRSGRNEIVWYFNPSLITPAEKVNGDSEIRVWRRRLFGRSLSPLGGPRNPSLEEASE